MKVVILAGGYGTRMREETEFKPKPMVEVGGHPVLWHIMKNFAKFGHKDFVIATGLQYSVRDFVNEASPYFGMNIEWQYTDAGIEVGVVDSAVIAVPEFGGVLAEAE